MVHWPHDAIFNSSCNIANLWRLLIDSSKRLDQSVFDPASGWLRLGELSLTLQIAHLCVNAFLGGRGILIHGSKLLLRLLLDLVLLCTNEASSVLIRNLRCVRLWDLDLDWERILN